MNTVAEEWERFSNAVIPSNAPEIQRIEMRRTFYASAYIMLKKVIDISANQSEDAAIAIIDGLLNECVAFGEDVKNGKT